MRGELVFLTCLLFIIVFSNLALSELTGKATTVTNLTINIDTSPPSLILYKPENITYDVKDIPLEYSVNDSFSPVDHVWFNLDGGSNGTLTGNTTIISISNGNHILTLYANDSSGLVNSTSVTFYVYVEDEAGGGGPGGGGGCNPDWLCTGWSECFRGCIDPNKCEEDILKKIEEKEVKKEEKLAKEKTEVNEKEKKQLQEDFVQIRNCTDLNACNMNANKPETIRLCCVEHWECSPWEECIDYLQIRNCTDLNNCSADLDKPDTEVACGDLEYPGKIYYDEEGDVCLPDWDCTAWGECGISYSLKDVIFGDPLLHGRQKRECNDLTNCTLQTKLERKKCSLSVPVSIRKIEWCFENYIEVYEISTNKLVSRIREDEIDGVGILDIGFLTSDFEGYCDFCYNNINDYDEEGTDCGGKYCPECREIVIGPNFFWWILFVLWMATIFLGIILIKNTWQEHQKSLFNIKDPVI